MVFRRRWWLLLIPLGFGALVFTYVWIKDPYFYLTTEGLFRRAQEAEARGDLPLALELAEKAWQRHPRNSDCGTLLGWLYLKRRQPEPALKLLRQVWNQDPKATAALKGLALALDQMGQGAEAREVLARYLEQNPQDADVLLFAAQLAGQREEDQDLALKYYEQHHRLKPTPEVRRVLVDLLCAKQRFKEAIPLQEEEAAQNPEPAALHRLALLHYWSRDYEAASQVYERLLEKAAENALYRQEAAKAADAAKRVDAALKHYLWLYAKSQGTRENALALARLWSQKGNHQEAAAVLAGVLEDKPEPDTMRWYALELLLTGDFKKARQIYQKAWERGDTHQETIINLARLYAREKQFSRAVAMWQEAERRQLVHGDLRWEAALTYSYAQKYREALNILKPVERDNPRHPQLLVFLGQMHFYQKHWGLAAHYFQQYLEKHPEDQTVRQLLAEALSFQPETRDQALKEYGELLKHRDEVSLRLRRAALLLEAKRWAEAEGELKECPIPQDDRLLKEQARLLLWAGDLEASLDRYQRYLERQPRDREILLEKARVLIYLGRALEALKVLRSPELGHGVGHPQSPEGRALLVAWIQAALAQKDWPEASRWALRLLRPAIPAMPRPPQSLKEAHQWFKEAGKPEELSLEERTWVARALCHAPEPEGILLAAELALANLRKNRYHHASLLILTHLLPRFSRFEELSALVYRIPGIRADGPEYVAALAFFDSQAGRHGGKLNYLLHVLQEYRRHRVPDSPGELLALADLANELGNPAATLDYLRRAQEVKPQDRRLAQLVTQCQLAQKDYGRVLVALKEQAATPETALEMARLYLMRGQYEGVKAAAAQVPAGHSFYSQVQLLKVQACRLQQNYNEALETLEPLAASLPREDYLMEKARILEAMGDRRAVALYTELMKQTTDPQRSRVAAARRARALGDPAGAYKAFALAVKEAPQDLELLHEMEAVRQSQRPFLASRAFPYPHGERRPEETLRPWQFSRPDREVFGGLPKPRALPVAQPETLWFQDKNQLYGWILRATAGFWIAKVVPVQVAVEYRYYHQNRESQEGKLYDLGLDRLDAQAVHNQSRLTRADLTLGVGPLNLGDRLRLSGDLILRGYWSRVVRKIVQTGAKWYDFPPPRHLVDEVATATTIDREYRSRLLGQVQLDFPLGPQTDAAFRYARRDLFDLDPYLFPRLYQSVQNLGDVRLVTYHQMEFSYNHQFTPRLVWRGQVSGAFFSDNNRRLSLYQGLTWEALKDSRLGLALTPHYYLAAYQDRKSAYFSPNSYNALGLTVDFHRQVFRLPTLVLQGTLEAVGQDGRWGPALNGLAALEFEPVRNFLVNPHVFYFREWVNHYHIFTAGLSLRYTF